MKRLFTRALCVLGMLTMVLTGKAQTSTLANDYLGSIDNNTAGYYYADVNGDGVKERFALLTVGDRYSIPDSYSYAYDYKITWINMRGEQNATYTLSIGKNVEGFRYILHDFNNDNIPDFLWFDGESPEYNGAYPSGDYSAYIFKMAYSTSSGYVLKDLKLIIPQGQNLKTDLMVCGDFNRDGRQDIFSYETYKPDWSETIYTPYLYLQTADGTFVRTPFPVTTDMAVINEGLYGSGASSSFTYNTIVTFSGACLAGRLKISHTPAAADWQILDLNQDGYLDIISRDGMSFISMPNGLWYSADIAGTVGMCDFNADGVKDLVVFDAATGQVDLTLSASGGLVQSSLYNNKNITHVICEDMDKDGMSDILLLATTTTHQYMVFFKNQGDGTFKRNERNLAGKYEYHGLYHFNANGFPTLVFYVDGIYKRVDWDSSFTLTEAQLIPSTEYFISDNYWINDFYGDGKLYATVAKGSVVQDDWGTSFNIESRNHIYLLSEATTAPQAQSKPNVVVDKNSGAVKVEWAEATDAETSQPDLDYEVRIRSAASASAAPAPMHAAAAEAQTFTITFDGTSKADGQTLTSIADMIGEGAQYVESISTAEKIFAAAAGNGIKFGSSSVAGKLSIVLKNSILQEIQPNSVEIVAKPYKSGEGGYTFGGEETALSPTGETDAYTKTFAWDAQKSTFEIVSTKRFYLLSVTFSTSEHAGGGTSGGDSGSGDGSTGGDAIVEYVSSQLLTHTAGNNLLIFDPTTWASGDYTVEVRAIDKMNLAGAWSEAVTFTNSVTSVDFTLSEETLFLADTLVVTSLTGSNLTLTALPDGEILSNKNGVARIIFKDLGNKTITATSPTGAASQQTLYVEPFKDKAYHNYAFNATMFDFNQDGKLEAIGNDGLYTLDKGIGTLYPSLNLSDIQDVAYHGYVWIVDNNHDGLPDIFGRIRKNDMTYSVMHNTGDLDFNFQEDFTCPADNGTTVSLWTRPAVADLDNDGLVDFVGTNEGAGWNYTAVYKNNGTREVTRMTETIKSRMTCFVDMNNDGYVDLIQEESDGIYLHLNKGNFEFERSSKALPTRSMYASGLQFYDANYDGYKDIVVSVNAYEWLAYLGSEDLSFTESIDLPGRPTVNDLDNDGRYDYLYNNDSIYLDRADGPVYVSVDNFSSISETGWRYDIDEDGYPDIAGGRNVKSRIVNTAPTAPSEVYVSQTDNEVVVQWEGASDKESHYTMLRYNLSVREKGTNYYVISPLNANKNTALTVGTSSEDNNSTAHYDHYRSATRYPIPASVLTLGKTYEICVQTIDPWFAHSDFSEVIEFKATKMLINLPAKGGVGIPVPFSTNGGETATVTAEGGVVKDNTITWNTEGVKTVTVTVNGVTTTQTIRIVNEPTIALALPEDILEDDVLTVDLPAVLAQPEYKYSLTSDNSKVRIELLGGAKVRIHASDDLQEGYSRETKFTLTYEDAVFGKGTATQTVKIHAKVQPTLQMVTVESAGIRLSWNTASLPKVYTGQVNIYRETTVADQYELLATVPFSSGTYLDATAVPEVRSSRYVIALPTAYGTEGEQSAHHTSIHTMINQGMGNNVNLYWTHYEGAPVAQYTILSGSSPDNLTVLDNVSGNAQSYTHRRATNADTYYALAYTLKSAMAAPSILHSMSAVSLEGRSNVICSNEAYNVIAVESITISSRESNMELSNAQKQLHLIANVAPMRATLGRVSWSITAGEEHAVISSNGVLTLTVTTKVSGTITVQAKAIDGSEVTETVNIPFAYDPAEEPKDDNPSENIAVTGIILDTDELTLYVNDTHTLHATIEPQNATDKSIIWATSDDSVVTVSDEGVLTARAKGTALIVATTFDGGFTAACVVTVLDDTALENLNEDKQSSIRKVYEDGVIYVLRNGKKYTLDGREAK